MSLAGKEQGFMRTVLSHRLFKNTSALVVLQLFNYLAPLIVLIHLTRVLGIELYGVVAFSMGMIQFSFVVMDFGFSLSATQKISQHRERRKYIGRLLGSILTIKLALFLLIAAAITLYIFNSTKYEGHRLLFFFTLLPILGQGYQPTWLFSGLERMGMVTAAGVVSRVIFVILTLSFVRSPDAYLLVPIGNGIAQVSAAIFSFLVIFSLGFRVARPRIIDIKYTLRLTFEYFLSRLAVVTYMSGGVMILGAFSTSVAVAVYSLAEQLYRVMQAAFAPINQSIFPFMAKERDVRILVKVVLVCVIMACLGAIVGYLASPYLIPVIFGQAWIGAVELLYLFFVAIVIHVGAVMCGYPLAVTVGRVTVANRSVVQGAVIYFIGAAALIAFGWVRPEALVFLMICAELYVLVFRGVTLWPMAVSMWRSEIRGSVKF